MVFKTYKTHDELNAAYDVESSVPDFMVYAHQYIAASEHARASLPWAAGVKYGETVDEYIDVFPAARPGAPVHIFIHGGYWRMLSAREFSFVALGFAPAGVTTVIANYALAPAVSISEISRQMRAMVAWCARNIADYNGDPDNMLVSGHSAGGHLAAMCALADWETNYGFRKTPVRAFVPISGLFDLEPLSHVTFMGDDLQISGRDIDESSPQRLIRPCSSKLLISYGTNEPSEFERHSAEFQKAWDEVGNESAFFPQMGRNHFNAITDLGDSETDLTKAFFDLMDHSPSAPRDTGRSRAGSVTRTAHDRVSRIDRRLFPRDGRL